MLERIGGVVGSADHLHPHLFQEAARREGRRGEHRIALLPDLTGGGRREEFPRDAERVPELQMGPVVERVAEGFGHRPGPLLELLPIGGVAGDITLVDARRAHGAPLVVIAGEPDRGQVLELPVPGDIGRREVAMIVDDRQRLRIGPVQVARRAVVEEEVLVHKLFAVHGVR